MRRTSTRN